MTLVCPPKSLEGEAPAEPQNLLPSKNRLARTLSLHRGVCPPPGSILLITWLIPPVILTAVEAIWFPSGCELSGNRAPFVVEYADLGKGDRCKH